MPTPNAIAVRHLSVRDAADSECVCGEPITVHRFSWRCPTCQASHVATACYNCSRPLDYGTDHGEPHHVALVAAFDDHFIKATMAVCGWTYDEVRENSCAVDGPARHLQRATPGAAG